MGTHNTYKYSNSYIEKLYDCVVKNATNLRVRNSKANGLFYWSLIKEILTPISHIRAEAFLPIDKETYQSFMALPEKTIDGYGNITMMELNHFVIQLVRIPHNEQPSIIKILQLAYNYGQYVGTREKLLMKSGTFNGIENVDTIYKFISMEYIELINHELETNDIKIEKLCQDIQNAFSK
jgi:hypothetical protein